MKRIKFTAILLILVLLFTSCTEMLKNGDDSNDSRTQGMDNTTPSDLGGFDETFGKDLAELGIYDGYFEEETVDISVKCVSGTKNAYKLEGNTLTFNQISQDSVYSISGKLCGNIIINTGDNFKFDLEMQGLSLVSKNTNPILVMSGDKVSLTAKKECKNYIYDMRDGIDENDQTLYSGAVYSETDLEVCGKGELAVVSWNNNGIHTKKDLEVKNLTLRVACTDNAIKGNDSVGIDSGNTTLIATKGDGIKTTNSDISSKGKQRGTVSIIGGSHTIYAACDGIDAAYDTVIDGSTTVLNIYTDKYSNYSEEVTANDKSVYYIRYTNNNYKYSVKYYNSDSDVLWVNAEYHSSVSGGRSNYYYYSIPKNNAYSKMQFFVYSSDMNAGQESEYVVASELLTPSTAYDTFALSNAGNSYVYTWTNYTTQIRDGGGMERPGGGRPGDGGTGRPGEGMDGPGGMGDGNSNKGGYSTKGIKAANEIQIKNGKITIKSYDDAIHANNNSVLENGSSPLGNVTVLGGTLGLYSNDDGIHADGKVNVSGGIVSVTNSYEGIEGSTVEIGRGDVSVVSLDDGINGTSSSGTAITISGGKVYVLAGGDGIDSNSRTSYKGIVFSGGNTAIISTSGGNSAIDSEQGYSHTGGKVLAVMPSGKMSDEAVHCQNFESVGISQSLNLSAGSYLAVKVNGDSVVTIKMPKSLSARVVYLGDKSASATAESSSSETLDRNGVCWN